VLIDRLDKSQRLLLNLGRHVDDYLPTSASLVDFRVRSIEWMPDQEGIIVGITNVESHQRPVRSAIVIVPTNGMQPYKVSEGTLWTMNPTGDQIVVLAGEEIALSHVNVLKLIDIDVNTGRFSERQYSLRPYAIYDPAGLVFFSQFPMFSIAFDTSLGESTLPSGGLTIFDTQTATPTIAVPNPEGYVSRLDSTPDGKVTIAQMLDGTLSRILRVGTTMELQPITSTPVTSWNLNSDGEILVQFAGDNTYQVLDAQGNIKQSFDLNQMTRSLGTDTSQIIAVDW
jgi:WD40 repeat protein